MFEDLKQGVGAFLGHLTGAMPSVQRDYGPAREAFQERDTVDSEQPTVRLVNDYNRSPEPFLETAYGRFRGSPGLKEMLEKYPDAMLPVEATREIFRDGPPEERLKELGMGEELLRSYAFSALLR